MQDRPSEQQPPDDPTWLTIPNPLHVRTPSYGARVGTEGREPLATAVKFLVGSRRGMVFSYTWRLGAGGTSFYVKPVLPALQQFKISLHGPDPRPGLQPGYKVELDSGASSTTTTDESAILKVGGWPSAGWFSGLRTRPGVDLVLRLRFTWDLFDRDAVSAPTPRAPRVRDFAGLLPPPAALHAVDVDVYVCDDSPYWPREAEARLSKACFGPVTNRAGQHLTAVAVHRSLEKSPSPLESIGSDGNPSPVDASDRVRGLGATQDESGFLWVQEMWLSRSVMTTLTPGEQQGRASPATPVAPTEG